VLATRCVFPPEMVKPGGTGAVLLGFGELTYETQ
jgi:hypothetical protein